MIIYLGSKKDRLSSSTYSCFGCHDWLEVNYDFSEGITHHDVRKAATDRGWVRRTFAPGADPWFCSQECAFDSRASRIAEKYWDDKSKGIENDL